MPHESGSFAQKASRSVQEHIEEVLKTTINGLVEQPEPEKAGRPTRVPRTSLWMAILFAVFRRLKSQRTIWRMLATGGWWHQPCSDVSDRAVSRQLEHEGWKPLWPRSLSGISPVGAARFARLSHPASHAGLVRQRGDCPG